MTKTSSLHSLDMTDYGIKNKKGQKYIVTLFESFSKCGWGIPLGNKTAERMTKKLFFDNFKSNCKPCLNESDEGNEFVLETFTAEVSDSTDNETYGRYPKKQFLPKDLTEQNAIRDSLEKPVF